LQDVGARIVTAGAGMVGFAQAGGLDSIGAREGKTNAEDAEENAEVAEEGTLLLIGKLRELKESASLC